MKLIFAVLVSFLAASFAHADNLPHKTFDWGLAYYEDWEVEAHVEIKGAVGTYEIIKESGKDKTKTIYQLQFEQETTGTAVDRYGRTTTQTTCVYKVIEDDGTVTHITVVAEVGSEGKRRWYIGGDSRLASKYHSWNDSDFN